MLGRWLYYVCRPILRWHTVLDCQGLWRNGNARCVRKDKQTADGQTKTRSDENLHKYIEVQTDKQTDKRTDKKMERLHQEIII